MIRLMIENLPHVPPKRSVKRNTVTIRIVPMLFDI